MMQFGRLFKTILLLGLFCLVACKSTPQNPPAPQYSKDFSGIDTLTLPQALERHGQPFKRLKEVGRMLGYPQFLARKYYAMPKSDTTTVTVLIWYTRHCMPITVYWESKGGKPVFVDVYDGVSD
ncbi:MAG: hypothetical protein OIF50_06855 [Flavobacteriaceae bacterium]|nr:hypothetical protein [Flavobacteriaceae bacterium]